MESGISRRTFVKRTGLLAGGLLLGGCATGGKTGTVSTDELPRRVLGKTGAELTALTLGTAPSGYSKSVSTKDIAEIVRTGLDLGITSFDTARDYDNAEQGMAIGLGDHRKDIFLATKVQANEIPAAEKSLSTSFKKMKTDYFDLLYLHNLGKTDVKRAMEPDGVFPWLLAQKKAGKCRFVGVSGHNVPDRFIPFIESGELDVVLAAVNFTDRYIYGFEDKVLPLCRKHEVGFIAMKVYGGLSSGFPGYPGPKVGPLVGEDYMELAVRYAMGLPGVTSLNIGVHEASQLKKNVDLVKNARALNTQEISLLESKGKEWSQEWGPHFGPVKDEEA